VQQRQLEVIDEVTTQAKLMAEQSCRKLTVGKVQWCPQLTHAIARILYWKGVRKRIRGGHIGAKFLARIAKKGGMSHMLANFDLSEDQVSAHVRTGYKKYNRLKNDKGRRDRWLVDVVAAQATATKTSRKAIWKKIQATEKTRNNTRQMAQATGKGGHRQGLNHVWGPDQANPADRHASKSKADLDLMCLAEAGRQFTQACHMPFLSPPLVDIFTESNVFTPAFEQVLQGTSSTQKARTP